MALDVNAALLQLDPLKPLNPSGAKDKDQSMQLAQLKLMREKFEYEKKRNVQEDEWRRIAEAGEMTRAQMMVEKQREADAEKAKAENMKERQEAIDSMNARVGAADAEGMHLDANKLNALGGLAEFQGVDENGMPSFRVELDAEEAHRRDAEQAEQAAPFFDDSDETDEGAYGSMEEGMSAPPRLPRESTAQSLDRMNALGYDTLGLRGNMAGTGIGEGAPLSTEEAFAAAQRAARGPDEPAAAAPAAAPAPVEPAAPAPWQPGSLDRDEPEPAPEPAPARPPSPYDLAGEQDAAENFAVPGRSTPMATPPPQLEPSIFQATGRPARGPDRPDIMGSVPNNVIDMGSMLDQRKQRLGPVMAAIEKSMPQAYQGMARDADEAALASGLDAEKTLQLGFNQRGQSGALLSGELAAQRRAEEKEAEQEAEKEKARLAAQPKPLTRVQIQRLAEGGQKEAKEVFRNLGLDEVPKRAAAAQTMIHILEDEDENNDQAIAFELPNMLGSKGPQSNKDLAVALGIDAMSTKNQIEERIHNIIEGGYTEMRKETLIEIIQNKMDADEGLIYQFLDGVDAAAEMAVDEDVRRGLHAYAAGNIDEVYRKAHAVEKASRAGAGAGAAPATGAAPDAGYTPPIRGAADGPPIDDYEQAIPKESRIAYVHKNPGNLMYDKDNPAGAEPGEDKEGGGKWARFPTVQAGFEALRGYIARHDDETIHDFIARYAPKEDGNDTEKYIADAVRELKAEPDDTVYNIDPYDLMRFIVRHESGTNMPYQYDAVDEKNRKLEAQAQKTGAAPAAPAAPAAAADDPFEGVD